MKTIGLRLLLALSILALLLPGRTAEAWARDLNPLWGDGPDPEPMHALDFKLYHPIIIKAGRILVPAKQLAGGQDHTCVLTVLGGVRCWGNNWNGMLGDGTTIERHAPVDVSGLGSGVQAIAAGFEHTCAITTGGGVKCWGANGTGQLGDNTETDRLTPVDVFGLSSGVKAIAAGMYHTCALMTSGGVKCWGWNVVGQLGNGANDERHTPVDVSGLASGVTAIAAGRDHTCARMASGGLKCWGANASGQLGDGATTDRNLPVDVTGLAGGVAGVYSGYFHTCAVLTGGAVKCWGENNDGALGDGTKNDRYTPVDVSGLGSGAIAIDGGWFHTCALMAGGIVKCWGSNGFGQLGDGSTTQSLTPVDVVGLPNPTDITAGYAGACAVVSEGGVKCWGTNVFGNLGDGTTVDSLRPVYVIDFGA